jgi:YVTN family beta-propeller protein
VTILPAWGGEKETVAVGGGEYSRPSGAAAVMTSTHHAYIVLPEDDAVSVLSGTHIVAEKIGVGSQPVDVAVDPGERLTYVVNKGSNNVTVLHETTVIQTVTVGITPTKVTVNPVNHLAYVTNSGNNTVTIIDPTSGYATTTNPKPSLSIRPWIKSTSPTPEITRFPCCRGKTTVRRKR